MNNACNLLALWLVCIMTADLPSRAADAAAPSKSDPILLREFVYEQAPFPSVHATTIAQTKSGLVSAFFGGTAEGNKDVGIWFSRHDGKAWSPPEHVANGKQDDGKQHPCWNPVLFTAKDGSLLLFYKVGPKPNSWWGMLITSADGGKSWSAPKRLPDGILGPVKNKPILLADGTLLCPSSTEDAGWRAHMEFASRADDKGEWKFTRTDALNDGKTFGLIQPTVLKHDGRLIALCRSKGLAKIVALESADQGKTWSEPKPTDLPNPNSGIDGVTLADGRSLLVYNHTPKGRSPLNVAVSADGKTWKPAAVLESEPGEYSYPAVIQTEDGMVHITYTWKRQKVRHVVMDPKKI
jgi:predicted neuraminidase